MSNTKQILKELEVAKARFSFWVRLIGSPVDARATQRCKVWADKIDQLMTELVSTQLNDWSGQ